MPVARADGEDIIIDQIINSLSAVDPTAALDMSSWLSSLDAALQGAANFDPSSLAGTMPDLLDPSSLAGATPDVDSALSAAATSADPAALPAAEEPDPTSLAAAVRDLHLRPGANLAPRAGLLARPSWATSRFSGITR